MAAYKPFLRTFEAAHVRGSSSRPTSPLEEEAGLPASGPIWKSIAETVKARFGLPLLIDPPKGMRLRLPPSARSRKSPMRYLILEEEEASWFVLEHPSALPLFDHLQEAGQRAALARPSLFTSWYLGSSQPTGADRSTTAETSETIALHSLIEEIFIRKASDWHLEPCQENYRARARIDGRLTEIEWVSKERGRWIINSIINEAGLGNHPPATPLDGAFRFSTKSDMEIHVRLSLIPSRWGAALVLRFLPTGSESSTDLSRIGLLPEQTNSIQASFDRPDGIWLLAGPTGSGKSTTLHTLLRMLVAREEKVVAVEDPVECLVPGVQQVQVDQARHACFTTILRSFLRQAPDSILVGEIRDAETAATAIQAAHSGHRILSSIHASDTEGVLRRFADLQQQPQDVTATCQLIIHQRLIPLLCQDCHTTSSSLPDLPRPIAELLHPLPQSIPVAAGCRNCLNGYSGRTGIYSLAHPDNTKSTRESLLQSARWHFRKGATGLESLVPYLPTTLRIQFPLCQV